MNGRTTIFSQCGAVGTARNLETVREDFARVRIGDALLAPRKLRSVNRDGTMDDICPQGGTVPIAAYLPRRYVCTYAYVRVLTSVCM